LISKSINAFSNAEKEGEQLEKVRVLFFGQIAGSYFKQIPSVAGERRGRIAGTPKIFHPPVDRRLRTLQPDHAPFDIVQQRETEGEKP
jgi:hypothetical protein